MNIPRMRRLMPGIAALLFAGTAHADAGVPMLFVTFPAMLVALVPVIALETWVLGRYLRARFVHMLKPVTVANLVSTIAGIPLTWFALVVVQVLSGGGSAHGLDTPMRKLLAVTWQAPWLIPYEGNLDWMIPAASLTLLVPFFLISYGIEAWVIVRLLPDRPATPVRAGVFRANLASYACLAVLNVCWLARVLLHHR